jgi:hypothetical protein
VGAKKCFMKLSMLTIVLFFFLTGNAQDSACSVKLNNDKITFTLARYGMDFTEKKPPKAEIIVQTSVKSAALWKRLKSLPASEWLCLLSNQKTDWAANLLLYQLYEKDAILYKKIRKREDWIKSMRIRDIEYWKSFLSKETAANNN